MTSGLVTSYLGQLYSIHMLHSIGTSPNSYQCCVECRF